MWKRVRDERRKVTELSAYAWMHEYALFLHLSFVRYFVVVLVCPCFLSCLFQTVKRNVQQLNCTISSSRMHFWKLYYCMISWLDKHAWLFDYVYSCILSVYISHTGGGRATVSCVQLCKHYCMHPWWLVISVEHLSSPWQPKSDMSPDYNARAVWQRSAITGTTEVHRNMDTREEINRSISLEPMFWFGGIVIPSYHLDESLLICWLQAKASLVWPLLIKIVREGEGSVRVSSLRHNTHSLKFSKPKKPLTDDASGVFRGFLCYSTKLLFLMAH